MRNIPRAIRNWLGSRRIPGIAAREGIEHFYHRIQGWFTFQDLYKQQVKHASDGDRFVEVGAWKGRSTAFMAVEIANSGKDIEFYVVDTWEGSREEAHQNDPDLPEIFDVFTGNLAPVSRYYSPLRMPSLAAAHRFEDESIRFVFIDASHEYGSVLQDLEAWYPKVVPGGVIAGHDYMDYYPGVVKAVDEFFGDKVTPLKEQKSWKVVK